jgi:hypothetical protein
MERYHQIVLMIIARIHAKREASWCSIIPDQLAVVPQSGRGQVSRVP